MDLETGYFDHDALENHSPHRIVRDHRAEADPSASLPGSQCGLPDEFDDISPLPLWKRCFDISGAMLGLILLSPVLLIVTILVKATSRGPLLFRHQRYGYRGEPFYVWKFRSLRCTADPDSHRQHVQEMANGETALTKINNDSKLTPVGKWLRCTAIDEVPQLFNVLKGEMSLVGPRPDVLPLREHEPWQRVRFMVLPGLTGLWQVSGKNKKTFREMMQLDADYVRRRSIWLDSKILCLTVPAIMKLVVQDYLPTANSDN